MEPLFLFNIKKNLSDRCYVREEINGLITSERDEEFRILILDYLSQRRTVCTGACLTALVSQVET